MKVYQDFEVYKSWNPVTPREFVLKSDHEAAMALKDKKIELLNDVLGAYVMASVRTAKGLKVPTPTYTELMTEIHAEIESALQRLAKG